MKKCSVSVVVKERRIKMVYYFLQYNLQRLKRNDETQCWQAHEGAGIFIHFWWECQFGNIYQKI